MLTEKYASYLAKELSDKHVTAKVGTHTTNGVKRHVVHVTHAPVSEGIRPSPYTVSSPS